MRDAGRNQRDPEAAAHEFLELPRHAGDEQGHPAEPLRHRQLDPKITRISEMRERPVHRSQRFVQMEIHGAERHHAADGACGQPIDDRFSPARAVHCGLHSGDRTAAAIVTAALNSPHFSTFLYGLNNLSGMTFPCATFPASLTCRRSAAAYAGSSCAGGAGSRTASSKSTTESNLPLCRIHSLTASRVLSRSGV